MRRSSTPRAASVLLGRVVHPAEGRQPRRAGQGEVLLHRPPEHQPLGLAVLGQEAHAPADGVPRRPEARRSALDRDATGARRVRPRDRARQLGAPGAEQAGEAHHLPAVEREADVAEDARPQPLDAQQLLAARHAPLRVVLLELAVRHQADQLAERDLAHPVRRHVPAVAHHAHARADALDLLQPVRDVDDGHALGGQPLDRGEERVDLAGGERGRGLVHDQQARVAVERLRHLDHLLLGDTQRRDGTPGVDAHARAPRAAGAPPARGARGRRSRGRGSAPSRAGCSRPRRAAGPG